MTKNYRTLTALSLALLIVLSPSFSFAKEKEKAAKHSEPKSAQLERKERDKNRSCAKAFGHLIAPGFIKKHGETNFLADCFVPFGILKKLKGNASSTPDTTAPLMREVSVETRATEAVVTWKTNERTDATVYWSLTSPVDISASSTRSSTQTEFRNDHRVVLRDLAASSTYYFVVKSTDKSGNTTTSLESSFTTKSLTADVTGPIISNLAVNVGTTTLDFVWNTNENATSKVYVSAISPLDTSASSTISVASTTLKTHHALSVTGLSATTTYYIAVESTDAANNKTLSSIFSATTH